MQHYWQNSNNPTQRYFIAANAMLSETNYLDDHSWQVIINEPKHPAFQLNTRYGGRVKLASLHPVWRYGNTDIAETEDYHTPPTLTEKAAGYAAFTAEILPDVALTAAYWVAESNAITGRFSIHNGHTDTISLRFDLFGQLIEQNYPKQIATLNLKNGDMALYLGQRKGTAPVVLVENGQAGINENGHIAPKIGVPLEIAPHETVHIRWSQAALPEMENSLLLARYWLNQNWQDIAQQITIQRSATPHITTGQKPHDLALETAYEQLTQAFFRAQDGQLPHPSFVTSRYFDYGWSRSDNALDHPRDWLGQNPTSAYVIAQAIASVNPTYAEGIVRNYIATQQADGWLDWAPGIAGQRENMLALPILARLTWRIYQQTDSEQFLTDTLDGLVRFFDRWFQADTDTDADSIPEWQSIAQTGYVGWPMFNNTTGIELFETPDIAAYLISEAQALTHIAHTIGRDDLIERLQRRIDALTTALDEMWGGNYYTYRDRDTHIAPASETLLPMSPATPTYDVQADPINPSRLVIEVVGGARHRPSFEVQLTGKGQDSEPLTETLTQEDFAWSYGRGAATTKQIYTYIQSITTSGLSRVFKVEIKTPALPGHITMQNIMPLLIGPDKNKQKVLLQTLKEQLLQPNGVALFTPPSTTQYSSSGVWVFWNTLICEALLEHGHSNMAVDILKRLLNIQSNTHKETGAFALFYHEEDMKGIGNQPSIGGLIPLHLLLQSMGIRLNPNGQITVMQDFAWGEPVKIRWQQVVITRTTAETIITTADKEPLHIPAGSPEQTLDVAIQTPQPPTQADKPTYLTKTYTTETVQISVDIDSD